MTNGKKLIFAIYILFLLLLFASTIALAIQFAHQGYYLKSILSSIIGLNVFALTFISIYAVIYDK